MAQRRVPATVVGAAVLLACAAGPAAAGVRSAATGAAVTATPAGAAADGVTARGVRPGSGPELTETRRLGDRRSLVVGDRFFAVGAEDATYPAQGWHITGEMGGFWSTPLKLLDGVWFGVGDTWPRATAYTSGHGYARYDYGTVAGVRMSRTDVAPDGIRAGLIGLRLDADRASTVTLRMDAHSELTTAYPWGWTTPSQSTWNLRDRASFTATSAVFRDVGTPTVANAPAHDWAAVVGSTLRPQRKEQGPAFRGPQGAVVCPAADENATCDDSIYGKGRGARLTYRVEVPAGGRTIWFAVAGSESGRRDALATQARALADPEALVQAKLAARADIAARSVVRLPGDRLLQRSVEWSKQNLADSVQEARGLRLRLTHEGKAYPAPEGTLGRARWIGAGWPDYPWIFATDGEYTAFSAVASGQFDAIKDHLRALRDISDIANHRSGKIVHEVVPDGSIYFGGNSDSGNTDESVKYPSAVALVWRWTGDASWRDEMYDSAVRAMKHVYADLDADGDGWPEGAGNVERTGMGPEKLDNAVYAIRGLYDLADMARSKGDSATATWATTRGARMRAAFERAWWMGGDTHSYADSLQDPGDVKVFQRHWIGLNPVEAELPAIGDRPAGPVAATGHARETVIQHERDCYTGEFGLYHTGSGPTSAAAGNAGPSCDSVVSTVPAERSIFTLGTSIGAVAEANVGRMGTTQLQRYTTALARVQLDPRVWETPGAMPEIVPSPDFTPNIDRPWTGRSMAIQAWGTYGVIWPVVHSELGVAPDLGNGRYAVVPQVPDGQVKVSGRTIRLGAGSVDVTARRDGTSLTTRVRTSVTGALTVGAVLPSGTQASGVTLDGDPVASTTVRTARGMEVRVSVPSGHRRATLVVTFARS